MSFKNKAALALAVALALPALPGFAQTAASAPMTDSASNRSATVDQTFVTKAAVGGMTEVELGKLAQQNGTAAPVKDFGSQMVADHTKANDELAQLAKSKGLNVPPAPDAMHQKVIDKFSKMNGAGFDRAYMAQMVTDHKQTIALLEKASKSAKDPDLKAFATKTLPTVRSHLTMLQQMKMPAAHA